GNTGYTPPQPVQPEKKSEKGKKVLFSLLIVIVIAASLGIGMAIGGKSRTHTPTNAPSSQDTTVTSVAVQVETTKSSGTQLSAVDVAEKVRPGVVGVMAYLNGQLEGEGSGVIFCEDSTKTYTYIMTCAHVISDEGLEFSVLTLDGKPYDAKLVGFDERSDIGVLRIEASGLPVATLGDSSSLKIGENVYAIGNPGGSEYFGSMTSGIVSAIDRSISSTYTMKVIQHDAAINPGNSGGALVNTSGQVIGINSSKIADTEFEGMGFAIPMSTAKSVAESLISYGYVPNRPMLGIKYADVSNYQFYSMLVGIKDLPRGSLIISSIATNSDLAKQDVKSGDLIIAVNGTDMDTSDILLDLIEKSSVGDTLTLTICRVDTKSYKTTTFDVKVKLVEDKGNTTYADEEETTTQNYGGFPFGGSDYYDDFFRQFFGF
ncbi:MAG: trypsin-like peptidase domain-containing protein, partial [Clostridia bacterium]|nr:trypsin-like peptidase domain-containing protein [Clostridia bacterium]